MFFSIVLCFAAKTGLFDFLTSHTDVQTTFSHHPFILVAFVYLSNCHGDTDPNPRLESK